MAEERDRDEDIGRPAGDDLIGVGDDLDTDEFDDLDDSEAEDEEEADEGL